MSTDRLMLIAHARCNDPASEPEWNAWYDATHLPDLLEAGTGVFVDAFRETPVSTIYGGTLEVLRSLIAEDALGLPRSR